MSEFVRMAIYGFGGTLLSAIVWAATAAWLDMPSPYSFLLGMVAGAFGCIAGLEYEWRSRRRRY